MANNFTFLIISFKISTARKVNIYTLCPQIQQMDYLHNDSGTVKDTKYNLKVPVKKGKETNGFSFNSKIHDPAKKTTRFTIHREMSANFF
jgi:hypothetical protein